MGAPMAGVSGGLLAAATSRAGALGFIAAGHLADPEFLREQVRLFRSGAPDAQLALGFIGYSSTSDGFERLQAALDEHRPAVVQFFAPALIAEADCPHRNVELAHAAGAKVIAQVGCVRDAEAAFTAGVDCVIAQGREAGGHGLRTELGSGTLPLAARIVTLARKHAAAGGVDGRRTVVLAAGGISDGRGLAAALALGCDGVVLGTRLWASREAMGHDSLKQALVGADADDVMRTTVFDTILNVDNPRAWPMPYDSVGALANETTDEWHHRPQHLEAALAASRDVVEKFAAAAGDPKRVQVLSGEGIGDVEAIQPAEQIIHDVEAEAISQIAMLLELMVATGI